MEVFALWFYDKGESIFSGVFSSKENIYSYIKECDKVNSSIDDNYKPYKEDYDYGIEKIILDVPITDWQ